MVSFAEFILSDIFVWFWVLVAIASFFVPMGIYGLVHIVKWANRQFIYPKKGKVLIRQVLANGRMREFWAKPTGKNVTITTIENKEISVPFRTDKGYMVFEGNVPMIMMNEHNAQILIGQGTTSSISQEDTTKGWRSAYETGKLIGAMDLFGELKRMLILGIIILAVLGGASAFLAYETYNNSLLIPTSQDVANSVVSLMRNTTVVNPIPTV